MNIKRAFFTATAILMVPGFASAATFPTDVNPVAAGSPDLTITCNAGLPLTQTAPAGTTFTVTELAVDDVCEIVMAGDLESGWESDDSCSTTIVDPDGSYPCTIVATPTPYDYYVSVSWDISEDADPGTGSSAVVNLMCTGNTYTSTTYDAAPGDTIPSPAIAGVVPPSTCTAVLSGYGSAVEVDGCASSSFTIGGGDMSCSIEASAFYEGIPTLSQYGMAIMVLLMLGVGFVGFRRFV